MSREDLIELCIKKDMSAWDEFIKRYQDLVRKAAHYRLNKVLRNDADDIVQEVFFMIWKDNKLSRLRDASRLEGWLTIVTINLASSFARASYKRSIHEKLSDSKLAIIEDAIASSQPDPARFAEIKEEILCVEESMNVLKKEEKVALELKLYDGQTQKEIADAMNIPANTAASLIHRAKIKIREDARSNYHF